MGLSKEFQKLVEDFREIYGYDMTKMHQEEEKEGRYVVDYLMFERKTEGNHHVLILEDHTYEKYLPDFNPKKHQNDIGDWIIFSYLTDETRDWFGRYTETQYPLTYTEYKMIEAIIKQIEREQSEAKGE